METEGFHTEDPAAARTAKASEVRRRSDEGYSQPLYPKLRVGRRGSDGPTDREVASHQRARLCGAMVRAVASHGYEATTVRQLSALAGVSTRTLYELFAGGKRECLLSAYDAAVRRMARRVALAYGSERDGSRALARALEAFAFEVSDRPQSAELVLVEVFAAGPAALERVEYAQRLFEGMVGLSLRAPEDGRSLPPPIIKGIVAGMARVARVRTLEGRTAELPALSGELLRWALSYRSPAATALEALPARGGRFSASAGSGARQRWTRRDDRTRLLEAASRIAAQDGYASLSPAAIAQAAGVSRRRFARHFEDVQECFTGALEHRIEFVLCQASAAAEAAQSWPGGLHRAISRLCACVIADPLFARLAFLEVLAPGPQGVRLREALMGGLAGRLCVAAPGAQPPTRIAADASVGAIWGIIHHHVVHGAADRLIEIAPQLSFLALAPALGARPAVEAILREHAQLHAQ